jgi:hypothetical protein
MLMPLASLWTLLAPDLIVLAIIAVPIPIAVALNRRFQRRNPGKRPYRWGYYFSISSFIGWLLIGFASANSDAGVIAAAV